MKTIILIIALIPYAVLSQISGLEDYPKINDLWDITPYEPKGELPYIQLNDVYAEGTQYTYRYSDFTMENYNKVLDECMRFLEGQNISFYSARHNASTVINVFNNEAVMKEVVEEGKKLEMKWYLTINNRKSIVVLVVGANDIYLHPDISFTVCQFDLSDENNDLFTDLKQSYVEVYK